jgi:PAS domain S-box-containing protein
MNRKVEELEAKLAKTLWLHEKEHAKGEDHYTPFYGDVTELNTERTILDSIGKEMFDTITSDLMDLLDTSVAIYEKNGDYAFGKFNSGWCQLLDASSRKLCKTKDNKTALACGKWLCHDDCWNNSALAAIKAKKSTDIDCVGSIKLYAEPIFVQDEVIGVINVGYGNPPTDDQTLRELAGKYNINFDTLKQKALAYHPRPDFIIGIAKKRLNSIAKLIGETVSRKQSEQALRISEERLRIILDNSPFPTAVVDEHDQNIKYWSTSALNMFGHHPGTTEEWYEKAYPDPEYRKKVIERWKPFVEIARKSPKPVNAGEYTIRCKDGTIKICELHVQFIPGNLIVTLNDISEKKDSEEKLKSLNQQLLASEQQLRAANQQLLVAKQKSEENEAMLKAAMENSQAGIAIADHLMGGGPRPELALQRRLPSFRCKRWLRRLYDLGPPNRLYDLLLDRPALRRFAQLVFFHNRGLLSRELWTEWLSLRRDPTGI